MRTYQAIPETCAEKDNDKLKTHEIQKPVLYGIHAVILFVGISLGSSFGYFYPTNKPLTTFRNSLPIEEREELALIVNEKPYDLSMTTSPPNNLLYLNTLDAFERLTKSTTVNSHYFFYESGFEAQMNQMYCAVATSSALLNSLRYHTNFSIPMDRVYYPYPYATQVDILFPDRCVNKNVILSTSEGTGVTVPPYGLSLAQVTKLLDCHLNQQNTSSNEVDDVWKVYQRPADPNLWNVDLMRNEMIDILNNEDSRVAINYHRKELGQVGGGHFSPIGAYDPNTDSFLILDVAKYKYPPVWAPAKYLFDSMATYDSCGIWNFPQAQDLLNDLKTYDKSILSQILGCKASYRGYVVVERVN